MNKVRMRVSALAAVLVLALGTAGCAGEGPAGRAPAPQAAGQAVAGAREYARSGPFGLWADGSSGEVWLQNAAGDKVWTTYPPLGDGVYDFASEERRNAVLSVYVVDDYNNRNLVSSYSGSVARNGLTLAPVDDGVVLYFDFPGESERFRIPVRFILSAGRLRTEILFDELVTYGDVTVHTVDLMPYFGAATKEDEGYLLVPDGCGALIRFDSANKEADVYSQPVYGKDPALTVAQPLEAEEKARLPVYGVYKNGRGFIAVAEQGDCAATVNAGQPGKISVFSHAGFTFTYTQRDSYTIADKDANAQTVYVNAAAPSRINPAVTYLFLEEGADYVGMAQALRAYLIETQGFTRTADGAAPLVLSFYGGAAESKTMLGIPYRQLQVATTFQDVADILTELDAAGVQGMRAMLCGFQKKGMYAGATDGLQFDKAFGGADGFRQLCARGQELGIGIYPRLDFTSMVGGGRSEAARMISGDYLERGLYRRNTGERVEDVRWLLRAPAAASRKAAAFLQSDGAADGGGLYLGDLGDLIYGDYNVRALVQRDETKTLFTDVLRAAADPLVLDGGNLYAARYADMVLGAPETASGYLVETDAVPFYQLVMHGLTTLAGAPFNERGDPEEAFLDSVSLGYALHVRLTAQSPYVLRRTALNDLLSTHYADWKDDIVRLDGRMAALDGLTDRYITGYRRDGDMAVTTYEDGTRVYVNYGAQPLTADGAAVPARDFVCIRAQAQ